MISLRPHLSREYYEVSDTSHANISEIVIRKRQRRTTQVSCHRHQNLVFLLHACIIEHQRLSAAFSLPPATWQSLKPPLPCVRKETFPFTTCSPRCRFRFTTQQRIEFPVLTTCPAAPRRCSAKNDKRNMTENVDTSNQPSSQSDTN